MKFQIWESVDGEEGSTQLASDPPPKDLDDRLMLLRHEYEVDGDVNNVEDVKRAFAYSSKWQYDQGEWPEGCRPLDNIIRRVLRNWYNKFNGFH